MALPEAKIYRAGPPDASAVANLLDAFNREFESPTLPPQTIERNLSRLLEADALTVFIAERPPQGFALLSFRPTVWGDGPVCLIEELYVRPRRRGQGLGRALMEAVLAEARARGCVWIEVTTGESDTEARVLYERFGFTNIEDAVDSPRMLYYELELAGDFIRPQA